MIVVAYVIGTYVHTPITKTLRKFWLYLLWVPNATLTTIFSETFCSQCKYNAGTLYAGI